MSFTNPIPAANRLLATLPVKDQEHLLIHCELVDLHYADILYLAGEPMPHVYFPTNCCVCQVIQLNPDSSLEVGLVGNEGMLGNTLMLGIDLAPFQTVVQGAGSALRITTALFLDELQHSRALQEKLSGYLFVSITQLAQTAACNRYHQVEARLARWLLMTHDRLHADTFYVTHLFLANMLGVRRVGVTKAALSLQQHNLISYRRGHVTILDRSGLKAMACSCYLSDTETYQRILG